MNGERASYSAPKFARMQERTRSQMLEDIVANLANHAETGQIPKPYRRGSWRPIGHMRPSSPLLDSVRDQFEGSNFFFSIKKRTRLTGISSSPPLFLMNFLDYDQLAKDFTRVFLNQETSILQNAHLFDVVFLVGTQKQKTRLIGVRAILGVRSRVFQVISSNFLIIFIIKKSCRKCYMEFKLVLDLHKCQLQNFSLDLLQHFSRLKIIVQKAPISFKFPI